MFESELHLFDLAKITHVFKWKYEINEGNPVTIYFSTGESVYMINEEAERFVLEYREYLKIRSTPFWQINDCTNTPRIINI
jgi:hypothetical protein